MSNDSNLLSDNLGDIYRLLNELVENDIITLADKNQIIIEAKEAADAQLKTIESEVSNVLNATYDAEIRKITDNKLNLELIQASASEPTDSPSLLAAASRFLERMLKINT